MSTPETPLYWLSRNGGQPEGPFDLPEIRSAWKAKRIRRGDKLMLDGSTTWQPADAVAGEVAAPAKPMDDAQKWQAMLDARDRRTSDNCGKAMGVLALFVLLACCIPGLGIPIGLALYGTFALIGTVLSIVQMVKGFSGEGIISLFTVYIGVPLLGFLAQYAAVRVFAHLNP